MLSNTSGYGNIAIGNHALNANTTGTSNTGIGYRVFQSNTTGGGNTATGSSAMYFNSTGIRNTANGYRSVFSNSSGNDNTGIGYDALYNNSTGSNNTAIGFQAGYNGNSYSNSTSIGNGANVTGSDMVRIGNASVISIGGQVGWTTLSDERFKKEVSNKVPGLDFIKKLRPVTYHLNLDAIAQFMHTPDSVRNRISEAAKEAILQTGFIAQEVEQAAISSGYNFSGVDKPKNADDYYGLRYAEFVVPLVKAVQELNEKMESQRNANVENIINELAKLKADNAAKDMEISQLKEMMEKMLFRLNALDQAGK